MTDVDLFALGCAVSFIALGGVYVYLRERFREHVNDVQPELVPVRSRAPRNDRAA